MDINPIDRNIAKIGVHRQLSHRNNKCRLDLESQATILAALVLVRAVLTCPAKYIGTVVAIGSNHRVNQWVARFLLVLSLHGTDRIDSFKNPRTVPVLIHLPVFSRTLVQK